MMLCSRNLALIIKIGFSRTSSLRRRVRSNKAGVAERFASSQAVPLTEPCRPSMDSAEARLITVCRSNSHREVQKAGLFLVELAEARQMHFAGDFLG